MSRTFAWPLVAFLSVAVMGWGAGGAYAQETTDVEVEAEASTQEDPDSTDELPTPDEEPQPTPPSDPPPQPQPDEDAASPDQERRDLQSEDRRADDRRDEELPQEQGIRRSTDAEPDTDREFDRSDRRSRNFQQRDFGIRFGRSGDRGLTIDTVRRNSVFYRNGLRQGDVLISVHGQPIQSEAEFVRFVSRNPDRRIPIVVLRDGREETIYFTYETDQSLVVEPYVDQQPTGGPPYLGVTFEPGTRGMVMVGSVMAGSPAEQAGLRAGDVLLALNGREITSPQDVVETVRSMQPGDPLDIEFSRRVADTTQAVIGARRVEQARRLDEPGIRREANYADPEDRFRRAPGDFDSRVAPVPEPRDGRPILRPGDQDGDGRLLDRDRRVVPRRRD